MRSCGEWQSKGVNGLSADAVRQHIARIAASEVFAGTERLRRFLRFTVEATLEGRQEEVKESVIGRKVFDRGDDYDVRLDPIVRVEARRLRARLLEYYNGPGREDPLRLSYPKGSYVPVIGSAESSAQQAISPSTRRRGLVAVAIALIFLIAVTAVVIVVRPRTPPMVAPIPGTWIEPSDKTLDSVDAALGEAIDVQLADRSAAHVVAWPEIVRHQNMGSDPLRAVARSLGASRLLVIFVRDQGYGKRVRIFIVDEPRGEKRLALTYADPALSTPAAQDALARRVVDDLIRTGLAR